MYYFAAALRQLGQSHALLVQVVLQQRNWLWSRNLVAQFNPGKVIRNKMPGAIKLKIKAVSEVYPRMRECYEFFAQKICLARGNYCMAVMVYLRLLVMCVQSSSPIGGPRRVASPKKAKGKHKRFARKGKLKKSIRTPRSVINAKMKASAAAAHKRSSQNSRPHIYKALFSVTKAKLKVDPLAPVQSGDVVYFVRSWDPLSASGKLEGSQDTEKLTAAMTVLVGSKDFTATLRVMKERFQALGASAFPPPVADEQRHQSQPPKMENHLEQATWPSLPYIVMLMGDTFVKLVAALLQWNRITQNAHAAQLLDMVVQTAFVPNSSRSSNSGREILWACAHPRKHLTPSRRSQRRFWAECIACLRSVAKARLSTVLYEVRRQRQSHPYLSRALVVSANVYMAQKDSDLAMQLFQQALSIQQQHEQHLQVGLEENQRDADADYRHAQVGVGATAIGLAELYFRRSAAAWRDYVQICVAKTRKKRGRSDRKSVKKVNRANVTGDKNNSTTDGATDNMKHSSTIPQSDSTKQHDVDDSEGILSKRVAALLRSHEAGLTRYKLVLRTLAVMRLQSTFRRFLAHQIHTDVVKLASGPPVPIGGDTQQVQKCGVQGYLQVYFLQSRPRVGTNSVDATTVQTAIPLPNGWEKRFNKSSQSFYFYNAAQDKSVTELTDISPDNEERDKQFVETTIDEAHHTTTRWDEGRWLWRWCTLLDDGTFTHHLSCWTAEHSEKPHLRIQLNVCAVEENAPLPGAADGDTDKSCVRVLNASKQVSLCVRNPLSVHISAWTEALRNCSSGAKLEDPNVQANAAVSTVVAASNFPCMPSAWLNAYTLTTDSPQKAAGDGNGVGTSKKQNEWTAIDALLDINEGPYVVLAPIDCEMMQMQAKMRELLSHALKWCDAPSREIDGCSQSVKSRETLNLLGDLCVLDAMSVRTGKLSERTAKTKWKQSAPRVRVTRLASLLESSRDDCRELLMEALRHYTRAFVLGQQHEAHSCSDGATEERYWVHAVEYAMGVIRPLAGLLRVRHLLLVYR